MRTVCACQLDQTLTVNAEVNVSGGQGRFGNTIAAKARLGEVFSGATRSPAEKTAQRNAGHAGLADDVGGKADLQ